MEDTFFKQLLIEEKNYIRTRLAAAPNNHESTSVVPRQSFMQLYNSVNQLPSDLQAAYKKQPKQNEYKGSEGRHYHLTHLNHYKKILVAEVSNYLTVRTMVTKIFILLSVLSILMISVALIVAYIMATRATAPLTKLAELLSNTSPQNLPIDFSVHYPDNEIGLLATKLEEANTRTTQFIRREQHFTRDTSHELRTPVTIIKNSIELLGGKNLTADEKGLIDRINLANGQMEQTINTLLSLARENTNSQPLKETLVLPSVEQAIIDQSYLLNNKDVEIDINISSSAVVFCLPTVLQILLNNLLSNAFQYTEQGNIFISFADNTLTVKDSGGGIDENIESTVLNNLVKGKKSKGFGIGLSLVKRLCETYQLDLSFTSTSEGVCIDISFP